VGAAVPQSFRNGIISKKASKTATPIKLQNPNSKEMQSIKAKVGNGKKNRI
jgi:hypothetical protein